MAHAVKRLAALGMVGSCLLAVVGCGSQRPPAQHATRPTSLTITEQDFKITAPTHVRAGAVDVVVHNVGPDDHALGIVKAPIVGELPMRADGITVDSEAMQETTYGGVAPQPAGSVTTLHLNLKPGRYELLCNMSGHYLGGMERTLVVT